MFSKVFWWAWCNLVQQFAVNDFAILSVNKEKRRGVSERVPKENGILQEKNLLIKEC